MDLAGRKLPMKNMQVFVAYLKQISDFALKTKGHPSLGKYVAKLDEARKILAAIVMKMVGAALQDPEALMLVAYPILESFGDIVAAFGLLNEAIIADQALTKIFAEEKAVGPADKKRVVTENPEAKFYHGKIQSAIFFANNILPLVKAREEVMKSADRSAIDVVF
jgi:Zn-dependent M28 family amino/carboxypeptidase